MGTVEIDFEFKHQATSISSPGEPNWTPAMPAVRCPRAECRTLLAEDPNDHRNVLCVNCGFTAAHLSLIQ